LVRQPITAYPRRSDQVAVMPWIGWPVYTGIRILEEKKKL
jgi:hypothetical protein